MNKKNNMNDNRPPQHVVVDVESDGPASGLYSMVSFAVVPIYNDANSFYSTIRPITTQYQQEALNVCKFTREQTMGFEEPEVVMARFKTWVDATGPLILWSDNPTFDGQWMNYYCHKYLGYNPFGFSGRRIGDLYSGLQRNLKASSDWKKLRTGTHSHNALDDARGNAGALRKILAMINAPKVVT